MDPILSRGARPGVRLPVLCAGLPRSASTWAFNVAAGLAKADGRWPRVTTLYSDDGVGEAAGRRMSEAGVVLIKSHAPSALLRCAFAWSGAPVLLTVRDPRDSAASLMQQFGFTFAEALGAVCDSAAALVELASVCGTFVLRYEDGFVSDGGSVGRIADVLGLSVAETVREQLWREMLGERVSQRLAGMAAGVAAEGVLARAVWDPETFWHPNHLGDGRVGKYRGVLTGAQVAVLEYAAGPFLRQFGYAGSRPAGVVGGVRVDFSDGGVGAGYLGGGFSRIEGWGVWTDGEVASLRLPLERPAAGGLRLELDCLLAPAFGGDAGSRAEIWVNGRRRTTVSGRLGGVGPEPLRVVLCLREGVVDAVEVEFRLSGLRVQGDGDGRLLGVGLRGVVVGEE